LDVVVDFGGCTGLVIALVSWVCLRFRLFLLLFSGC
jgi:hypothetical protein